jgi:hypothetical protein
MSARTWTGRDVLTNIFGLRRKESSPQWEITGEGEEVEQGAERREIMGLLREGPMKPIAISKLIHKNVSAVQRLLGKLCDVGLIVRTQYGTYMISGGASGATGKSSATGADE